MAQVLRNPENGQWAGMIGDGKDNVPQGANVPKDRSGLPMQNQESAPLHSIIDNMFGRLQQRPLVNPDLAQKWDTPDPEVMPTIEDREYLTRAISEGKDISLVETPPCELCKETGTIAVVTEDWAAGTDAYRNGELLQRSFPMLSPDAREQLNTGTHPACYDEMLG